MEIKPNTYYWAIYECRLAIIVTYPRDPNYFFAHGQDAGWHISCAIILKEVRQEEIERANELADLAVAAKNLAHNN